MTDAEAEKTQVALEPLGPQPSQMKEFDFIIGNWAAIRRRYLPDGTLVSENKARWRAHHLDNGRMVFDDFAELSPDGEEVSYAVTLRTFCPETNMWEMGFMFSLRQTRTESFRGQFIDGEGHFDAIINVTPDQSVMAKVRFFDIQKDSIEWSMTQSFDGGKTWFLEGTISAKRVS